MALSNCKGNGCLVYQVFRNDFDFILTFFHKYGMDKMLYG
jgi:hypothetical protein